MYSDVEFDTQLIVEIMERSQVDDENAPSYYFEDLAEQNESSVNHLEGSKKVATESMPHIR